MKNILLPTDFSENAWNATRYAIELFKDEPCNFHLLNTYTPAIVHSRFMAASVHGGVLEDSIRSQSECGLQEVVDKIMLECKYPDHNFNTASSFSLLTDAILDLVQTEDIDIVVTGTKGAPGLRKFSWGVIQ